MKKKTEAKILIVDDSVTNILLLRGILENDNFTNLDTAHNGKESLKMIASQQYDLILLDILMPHNVSGIDVLTNLKANPTTAGIPVIVISANNTREQIQECEKLGAHAYMDKPINIDLLLEIINNLFE